jgi:hypothetical protein
MKSISIVLLVYSTIFWSHNAIAQRLPDGGIYKVHVDQANITTDAEILPVKVPSRPDPTRWYYWFARGKISQTQGGFSGHLLHGAYHSFYEGGAPMETGNFSTGLKTGVWSSWNTDGILKQTLTYRDGRRSGDFVVYDEGGKVRQSGIYHDDQLEGAVHNYIRPDSAVITWYHQGVVVQHRPFLKRLNPFKKHQRDSTAIPPLP